MLPTLSAKILAHRLSARFTLIVPIMMFVPTTAYRTVCSQCSYRRDPEGRRNALDAMTIQNLLGYLGIKDPIVMPRYILQRNIHKIRSCDLPTLHLPLL